MRSDWRGRQPSSRPPARQLGRPSRRSARSKSTCLGSSAERWCWTTSIGGWLCLHAVSMHYDEAEYFERCSRSPFLGRRVS